MSLRRISIRLSVSLFTGALTYNDEARMTNDERSPNAQRRSWQPTRFRHSFVIGHSSFVIFSWRKSFDQPVMIDLSCITKAVVQTIRASLPEFHCIGPHSISTPVWRQRNTLVAKTFCHLCHSRVQDAASIEDLALTRGPRAQLAAERARVKIGLRFFTRGFFRFPADANLPVQLDPVKSQRRIGIGFELLSFFAFVVRKKDEPVLIETF